MSQRRMLPWHRPQRPHTSTLFPQVWDKACTSLLHKWAFPETEPFFSHLHTHTSVLSHQVWDKACTSLLHKWSFPEAEALLTPRSPGAEAGPGAAVALFARGAAAVVAADGSALLCFGSSRGTL